MHRARSPRTAAAPPRRSVVRPALVAWTLLAIVSTGVLVGSPAQATQEGTPLPGAQGTVTGWGHNGNGQATVPAGLDGVTAIAAGTYSRWR